MSLYYFSDVDDIDLYTGAMSEEHLPDSFLGPTFTCILAVQFRNLKAGDSFWYETSNKQKGFTPGRKAFSCKHLPAYALRKTTPGTIFEIRDKRPHNIITNPYNNI